MLGQHSRSRLAMQAVLTVESLRAKGLNISGHEKAWPPPSSRAEELKFGSGLYFLVRVLYFLGTLGQSCMDEGRWVWRAGKGQGQSLNCREGGDIGQYHKALPLSGGQSEAQGKEESGHSPTGRNHLQSSSHSLLRDRRGSGVGVGVVRLSIQASPLKEILSPLTKNFTHMTLSYLGNL